jgi:hypothetical protein
VNITTKNGFKKGILPKIVRTFIEDEPEIYKDLQGLEAFDI